MTDTVTNMVSGSAAIRTPDADAEHPTEQKRRPGLALVVIATAQLMVLLDLTIVNIALPSMQRELGFSTTGLSWVVDAYVLAFGGLLLLGGRTGDLFGRRRMLVIGIGLFTAASLAGGLATSQSWLITARVIQGIGAAIASPTALSLIGTTFPEGPRRHKAMAVYAGMSGAGGALGLLLGGLLVDISSWRWVLFVNVPIGLALIVAAPLVLPDVPGRRGRLDLPGALTVSAGMALLVFGLERAPTSGWSDPFTVASFVVAAILLIVFVLVETRSADALLPMRFLRNRLRVGGYAIMLLLGAAMLSLLYFLTQFLQDILHYSPLAAGVAYLPLPIVVGSIGLVVSRLVGRVGIRVFLTTGPLLVAGGLWWLSFLSSHSGYPAIFGPLVIVGLGMGLTFVPLTLNAVASVQNNEMGLASGLLNTSQQVGGSLGLAALVTVAATVTRNSLAGHATAIHSASHSARHSIAVIASVQGYQAAFRYGAIAAAVAVLFALVFIRPIGALPGMHSDAGSSTT